MVECGNCGHDDLDHNLKTDVCCVGSCDCEELTEPMISLFLTRCTRREVLGETRRSIPHPPGPNDREFKSWIGPVPPGLPK